MTEQKKASSPELRETLQRWLDDATSANPSMCVRGFGLCQFALEWGGNPMYRELTKMFIIEHRNWDYPFNESPDHYIIECGRRECHLNPARIAWVRDVLKRT